MLPELCAALLCLGIAGYVVLGGADFGAGFWDLTAGGAEKGARLRGKIKGSMSPVWEANHVWLIFVLVIFWTAFPEAFGSMTSTLAIPLFVAALGIILRGAAFALRGEAATMFEARGLGATFALSSLLVPFSLGAAVGAIASGRVPVGNAAGGEWSSWTGSTSIFIGLLAIAMGAHAAAVFLGADSLRAGQPDLVDAFRRRALVSGVVAGVLALAGLVVMHDDAPMIYDGLTSGAGLVAVIVSALAGVATLWLEWKERFELARFTVAAAVAAVIAGYALAQEPYLLPPSLTVDQAAAPDATLAAVLGAAGVGLVVLVPSLTYLFRLVLRGGLDDEFHPIPTGKPRGSAPRAGGGPPGQAGSTPRTAGGPPGHAGSTPRAAGGPEAGS